MMTKRLRAIVAGAALIALAACAQANETDATSAERSTAIEGSDTSAGEALELRLASGGLTIGEPGLHPRDAYLFGMTREDIVAIVTEYRGPPTDQSSNGECGAGPMEFTSFGPLTLNFLDGEWAGWSMSQSAGDPPLASEFGTAIGAGRGEINADDLTVEETSLGTEFDSGGIYGLFSGTGPNAEVTELWAGAACNFR